MLLGEKVSAADAASWGMIWRVVEDDALMAEAAHIARQLAAGPTRALGITKRGLLASAVNTLDAQLDLERDLQRECGAGEDYKEGIAAFLEKRPARFAGR
jgi:2-(1,2-epoxy-1,2-dihydrophenyl)acetyl-CoA isomerase